MRAWENAVEDAAPDGWTFRHMRHGAHECGWTCVVPLDEPARFQEKVAEHVAECPWPEPPEPVDTPSG